MPSPVSAWPVHSVPCTPATMHLRTLTAPPLESPLQAVCMSCSFEMYRLALSCPALSAPQQASSRPGHAQEPPPAPPRPQQRVSVPAAIAEGVEDISDLSGGLRPTSAPDAPGRPAAAATAAHTAAGPAHSAQLLGDRVASSAGGGVATDATAAVAVKRRADAQQELDPQSLFWFGKPRLMLRVFRCGPSCCRHRPGSAPFVTEGLRVEVGLRTAVLGLHGFHVVSGGRDDALVSHACTLLSGCTC